MRIFSLLLAVLSGCAARSGAPRASSVETTASDVAGAGASGALGSAGGMASQELRRFRVRGLEGRFTAQVEATEAPRVSTKLDDDGAAQSIVSVPVGTGEPIACLVSADMRDLGALVVRSTLSLKEKPQLPAASFPSLEVELAQHAPLVWATTHLASPDKAVDARFAVLAREGGSIFCLHVGAIPEGRFEKVVGGLVASAHHDGWTRTKFSEIAVMREGGKVRGVAQRRLREGGRETSSMSFFVERDKSWSAMDMASDAKIGDRGEVAVSTLVAAANGDEVFRATVTRKNGTEYAFEKRVAGATTHGTFRSPRPITTELSRAAEVRAFAGGKQRERTVYGLDNNPETIGARTVVMRRVGARALTFTSSGYVDRCEVANDGLCVNEDVTEKDGSTHSWQRLYAEGQP